MLSNFRAGGSKGSKKSATCSLQNLKNAAKKGSTILPFTKGEYFVVFPRCPHPLAPFSSSCSCRSPGPPSSVLTYRGRVEVEKHAKIELFNFLRGINLNKLDPSILNRKKWS